ncbi:hypothetical protein ACJJH9_04000 [Microbulbifer sp. DLAB2-AF]|uniref:hypothetical protein n=1 Tax=Microbulbifer sp. DLAB2-AF TaxID=3243395 RepID=UPI00403944AB
MFPPQVTGFKYKYSEGKVILTWNEAIKNGGTHHYKIFRDEEFVGKTRHLTYSDSDLGQEKNYRYKIIAVDHADQRSQPAFLDIIID